MSENAQRKYECTSLGVREKMQAMFRKFLAEVDSFDPLA